MKLKFYYIFIGLFFLSTFTTASDFPDKKTGLIKLLKEFFRIDPEDLEAYKSEMLISLGYWRENPWPSSKMDRPPACFGKPFSTGQTSDTPIFDENEALKKLYKDPQRCYEMGLSFLEELSYRGPALSTARFWLKKAATGDCAAAKVKLKEVDDLIQADIQQATGLPSSGPGKYVFEYLGLD